MTVPPAPPLSGVRVLELAAQGPVPMAATLLADLGAEVIRVDRVGPGRARPEQDVLGRSRRSVIIDLKHPDGRAVLLSLVDRADVLLEGFRPGVLERLDLAPADLLARRPSLIVGRMTGYGGAGPLAAAAGHDINYLAQSGLLSMFGPVDGVPVVPLNLVADYGGGAMMLVVGVLAALREAERSGTGQVIDAAMVDGLGLLGAVFHAAAQRGDWAGRGSHLLDSSAPFYRTYRTADGRHMAVGAIEPQFYAALLAGLGIEPAQAPQRDRSRWPELSRRFADVFATRTRDEWTAVFAGVDACVHPVVELDEAPNHPHAVARGSFLDVDGVRHPAPAPRLNRSPSVTPRPAPRAGRDTVEVLAECGWSEERIDALLAAGAVGRPEPVEVAS